MSFLVEDDEQTTLAVALAFIDECDSDVSTVNSSSTNSSGGDDLTSLRVVLHKPQTQQQALSRAKSTKKHREGKKMELLNLREQLVYLDARLSSLQLARRGGKRNLLQILLRRRIGDSADDEKQRLKTLLSAHSSEKEVNASTVWLDVALRQAKERAKSEALNAKIKAALQRQLQMNKAFDGLLSGNLSLSPELFTDKQSSQQDGQHDDNQQHARHDGDLVPPVEPKLLEELHEQLQQMYFVAGLMVDHQNHQNQSQIEVSQQSFTASSSTTRLERDEH